MAQKYAYSSTTMDDTITQVPFVPSLTGWGE